MPNATPTDAEIILKLYDLRREAEMRKARDFIAEFWPASLDDVTRLFTSFGTQENKYLRQVLTYWETAAALVVHGAVNESLYFETQGEMWFVYSKFRPYLEELRSFFMSPDFLKNVEIVAGRTPEGQKRLQELDARIKKFRAMREAAAAKKAAS